MRGIFRILLFIVPVFLFGGCEEDDAVGVSIQPSEDVLRTYSNKVDVYTSSILSDSVLSKYDYFLLGRYVDGKFGETAAEFMTQVDGRVGGLSVPDTSVVSSSSSSVGILNTLLTSIDDSYGLIESITSPKDLKVDSVHFYIEYDDFFGDSTALQAISVYELSSPLKNGRYFTNTKVADYCDKKTLLGQISYQIQNKRKLYISLPIELGEKLISVYMDGSDVKSQEQFNDILKGFYVSHTFNQGAVLRVTVAGVQVYYHYDATIKTTYNGKSVTVKASEVKDEEGELVNPLVSSFFLSANHSVNRVNIIRQEGVESALDASKEDAFTYTFTPAGLYTAVEIPFETLIDSVRMNASDTSRVMFNSASLIFSREELDWKTSLKSNSYLMLISKRHLTDFLYRNEQPDGISSFIASIDTTTNTYVFRLTAPIQNKMRGLASQTFEDDLILVPVIRSSNDGNYYYRQQLWLTATKLHSPKSDDVSLRPHLDIVYTKR